jgi:hypothetical protein
VLGSSLQSTVTALRSLLGSPFASILGYRDAQYRFAKYLAGTANIIKASCGLLHFAQGECRDMPGARGKLLASYFSHHAHEEDFHYSWILEDLAVFWPTARELLDEMSLASVLAVPGIAYYSIQNFSPICLLGYMAVLEGTPPLPDFIHRVKRELRLPEGAVRTLLAHAADDVAHARDLFALADSIDVKPKEIKVSVRTAVHTASLYSVAMRDVLDRTEDGYVNESS